MADETLQHPNYDELMGFVVNVYREFAKPGSEIKKMLAVLGSPAPEAFQQAMIEVRPEDGGFGLSHMPAKDWFNNDFIMRQQWASQIAALYEVYKSTTAEAVTETAKPDPIAEELKTMKAQLAALTEAIAAKDKGDKPVADKADEEETPAEDAAETPADEEEEDKAAEKSKGK